MSILLRSSGCINRFLSLRGPTGMLKLTAIDPRAQIFRRSSNSSATYSTWLPVRAVLKNGWTTCKPYGLLYDQGR
ncbi:hypothetical protein AB1N83_008594 [Pleurotus pulmonarius]